MQKYETRKCLTCGKAFEPIKPSQVCCTTECQKARKRKLDKYGYEKGRRIAVEYEALKKELEHVKGINAELEKRIAELSKKGQGKNPVLHECLRCNVKAMQLPCGKNQICWDPNACERCKGMKKPDFGVLKHKSGNYHGRNAEGDDFFERFKVAAE